MRSKKLGFDLWLCLLVVMACYTGAGIFTVTGLRVIGIPLLFMGLGFHVYSYRRWPPMQRS